MIKYSVAYWVKSRLQDSNRPAWDALLPALERYVRDGAHPEIDLGDGVRAGQCLVCGNGDRTVSCLQRIADLARPGTQVAAILPAGFMAKTRPAAQVQVCRRYQVLSEEPLDPDLFKPLAVPLTTLQVNGSG